MSPSPAARLVGVGMAFGPTTVLRDVHLDIEAGEVLALLGANGAGKSTLINVLSGVYPEHTGTVEVRGSAVELTTPKEARALGVATVHQRVADGVVPGLSVAENLVLDQLTSVEGPRFPRRASTFRRAREVAATLDLPWGDDVLARDVADLGISDAQLLVLARALSQRPELLILDEPTSALSLAEARRLFDVIERLRSDGLAIVYVSHRLGEIDVLANRAVVLRDGTVQLDARRQPGEPFDWTTMLHAMLGPALGDAATPAERQEREHTAGETVLELHDAQLLETAASFDLQVRAGEVTGVVGLIGAGKTELAHAAFGVRPLVHGRMRLLGREYAPRHPRAAVRAGVYCTPDDRQADGLLPGWSVMHNVSLPFLEALSRLGVIRRPAERALADDVVSRLGVVARDPRMAIEQLSGGNQQKVLLGRWLVQDPRLLLLDEPFRGVDVGARRDIGERVRDIADRDVAVVVLSSDVDEILEVADRVVVLVHGTPRLDTPVGSTSRNDVIEAMAKVG